LYEALNESRDLLKFIRPLVTRVRDRARRDELDLAYRQASAPLTLAVEAGHQFVYDALKERLTLARQRIEALFGLIANP
jgi:hypothetical protein